MYRINYKENFFSVWLMAAVCLVGVIIFLFVALFSYHPSDASWFYVASDVVPVGNGAGTLGAYAAALLFYFFGGAAFFLFVPLLFTLFFLVSDRSFVQEWERFFACFYLVAASAALFSTTKIDFFLSPYPGGMIGAFYAQWLLQHGDMLGRILFLNVSLFACCILLFRFSYMFLVQWSMQAAAQMVCYIKRYQVVSRIAYACFALCRTIFIYFPVSVARFIRSLIDGTAFDDTGLIIPDERDDSPADIVHNNGMKEIIEDLPAQELPLYAYTGSVLDTEVDADAHDDETDMMVEKVPLYIVEKDKDKKEGPQYALPSPTIFTYEKNVHEDSTLEKELELRAHVLQDKLKRFGVTGTVVAIKRGPVVTLFEYQPDVDTKISKIIALEDDLAMALQAMSIRIIAPIPGKSVVGFEVANAKRHDVLFSEVVNSSVYKNFSGTLPLVLGKGTIGEVVVVDLARMPHLLIAGSTGSGKSVALNALLVSLLCALNPDQLKLILIDPKRLEFVPFADIAHLLFPIVTSPYKAAPVLRWVVQEMEQRYEKMAAHGVRNVADYNSRMIDETKEESLPAIVVVIDELADLMLTVGRDIEDLITRITQMARAAGIHMIVATQRPSVDVITGLIKANFPSRISFRVASRIDSRTILDTMGADRLLGRGDMLFLDAATSQLRRVHGAYVSDSEIESVVNHIRSQQKVVYLDIHQEISAQTQDSGSLDDLLYQDIRLFLGEVDEVSISLLQRKFRIGYNRSARIIDMLESQGLIMPQDGGKTRKVIR